MYNFSYFVMTKLPPKMSLFAGSKLNVYNPSLDYFINRIKEKNYFSFIRFQIEYWRQMRIAFQYIGYPGWGAVSLNKNAELYNKIGFKMIEAWEKEQSYGRPWKFDSKIFEDHAKIILNPKPLNFYLGISDRAWYFDQWPPPPHSEWSGWFDPFLYSILPKEETQWNSLVWRRWGHSGKIQEFFKKLQNKTFCIVGPYYYNNFADKLQLPNAHFIEIDYLEASLKIKETYNKIIKQHEILLKTNDDVIYIIVGGAPGAWLVINLHDKLKNAFLIEVGRALDPYYYYDSFMKNVDIQLWGSWLKRNPPKWILNHPSLIR